MWLGISRWCYWRKVRVTRTKQDGLATVGEASREKVDIGPLVGIERFLTRRSEHGCGDIRGFHVAVFWCFLGVFWVVF